MPRSLLEILLEKKDPKKSLPYPTESQFYAELDYLDGWCTETLTATFSTENQGGLNVALFKQVRNGIKTCQATLRKYKKESQDYPWEDPTVQEELVSIRKKINGDNPDEVGGFILDLQKGRIQSLGEGDSYRIANTYFQTAESLRVSGTQKILKIASMRYKEGVMDRSRANTDLTENNEVNKKKLDITAKKVAERVPSDKGKMTDDQFAQYKKTIDEDNKKIKEANEKRKKEAIKLRRGIFDYLGTIVLGESPAEVAEKWGGEIGSDSEPSDPNDVQRKYRIELLTKAMPFIEKVTQRNFNEDDPFGDEDYMKLIMILASYSPGYKNYEPDPKDKVEVKKITPEEYKVIGEEMKKRQREINDLIDQIKAKHTGNGVIDEIITKEMEKAQAELGGVDPATACDVNSKKKLDLAREDLKKKIEKYGNDDNVLNKEDKEDLRKIADIIENIFNYCDLEEYAKPKEDKK